MVESSILFNKMLDSTIHFVAYAYIESYLYVYMFSNFYRIPIHVMYTLNLSIRQHTAYLNSLQFTGYTFLIIFNFIYIVRVKMTMANSAKQ